MVPYLVTALFAFWLNIFLGAFVLYKRPNASVNRVFSLWAFMVAIISAGDFFRKISTDPNLAMYWAKFMILGVIFMMPTLLHFALLFTPKTHILKKKSVPYVLYIPSFIFLVLLPTDFIVSDVIKVGWRFSVDWGAGMEIFACVFGAFMLTGAVILTKKVRMMKPINYYFVALGVIIVFGLAANFVPMFQTWDIPTISPLAMGASLIFGYTILRHKFIIVPVPESTLTTELKYPLEAGHSYLVKEEKPEKSFSIFVDLITHGYRGMCITRSSPIEIREKYNMKRTPVIWLTEIKGEYNVFDVQHLVRFILSFLDASKRKGVILLHGLEYLITHNGFPSTLKALHFINDYIIQNGAHMIIPISPLTLDTQQLKLLEAETSAITHKG